MGSFQEEQRCWDQKEHRPLQESSVWLQRSECVRGEAEGRLEAPGKPTGRCPHANAGRAIVQVFQFLFCLDVGASKFVYKMP